MRSIALAVGVILVAASIGCAENQQQMMADVESDYSPPASIYSVMDPTSLVYTDVAAGASPSDNPWRWTGFLLHPVGHLIDYGLNRPFYALGGSLPKFFGYTSEDAMLDAQRR